jgi:PEP-CTERM motif
VKRFLTSAGFAVLISASPLSFARADVVAPVPDLTLAGSFLSINTGFNAPNNELDQNVTALGQTTLSGTTIFGTASVTANVGTSPAPSLSVTTTGRGAIGVTELRYYFEATGPGSLMINVNASGSTTPLGAGEDAFIVQQFSPFSVNPLVVGSPTQGAWTINQEFSFAVDTIYQVSLQVQATDGGSASIDPIFTIDPADAGNHSLIFSAGITNGVPEPTTWAMMILGFVGIGFMAYRRKQNGSALGVA